jgi:hypothetical protein
MLNVLVSTLFAPAASPAVPVVANPVEQSPLKADVTTGLLGFQPLMAQDFLTFRQKLLVETGTRQELVALMGFVGHCNSRNQQIKQLRNIRGFVNKKVSAFLTKMLKIEILYAPKKQMRTKQVTIQRIANSIATKCAKLLIY